MSTRPEIILIAAIAQNGVIGRDNTLPWKLKGDLRHFKMLTSGHTILMGRKTWESLGRPLPERRNLVVTRTPDYQATGAEIFPTIEAALAAAADSAKIFVIGGGELYQQMLDYAHRLSLTRVQAEVAGDAYFPPVSHTLFKEVSRQALPADGDNEYAYDFVEYVRRAH